MTVWEKDNEHLQAFVKRVPELSRRKWSRAPGSLFLVTDHCGPINRRQLNAALKREFGQPELERSGLDRNYDMGGGVVITFQYAPYPEAKQYIQLSVWERDGRNLFQRGPADEEEAG